MDRSRLNMANPGSRDVAIAAKAESQYGVISREQLSEIGLGRSSIAHRVRNGRLHRLYPGTYAVGHRRISARGWWMAAVLSCGPNALLSHESAAALWGIRRRQRSVVDVTVPGRSRHSRDGIMVHRVRSLDEKLRTNVECVPVTNLARTLLDLAESLPRIELEKTVAEADRMRILKLPELRALMADSHGRHGLRPLRRTLKKYDPLGARTRSELERYFLDLCKRNDFPVPLVNSQVLDMEVDMYWPLHRLVVELDGWESHGHQAAFREDRKRSNRVQGQGLRAFRFTYQDVVHDSDEVVATMRGALTISG